MADPNTRTGKRTPVTLKIKFKSETLEQFIERYAVDVSQGGIFIRTKEPLPVGTQMRFEFQLKDASPLIGGEGTVVWTRENDPSRPAIAPGMGVRFDRLAEGSQAVLERILAEKAKQAPNRPASESVRPPLFTDTPTRVAPAPIQEQLLGAEKPRRAADDDQHTPLPKPMPFHSDADEFPDEAFEEATKVRALDDLVAQTAELGLTPPAAVADELAARRAADPTPEPAAGASPFQDVESSVPKLPSPPEPNEPAAAPASDTPRAKTPSMPPGDSLAAKTKLGLGLEAPRMQTPAAISGPGPGPSSGGPMKTGPSPARAVAAEPKAPVPTAPARSGSGASMAILILVLLAAGAAGVWFFVLRDKAAGDRPQGGTGSDPIASGSAPAGSGSAPDVGSGTGSNQLAAGSGSANVEAPKAPVIDTVIEANVPKARIEVIGTDQSGEAPFTAKLEKDRPYKARVSAPGHAALEIDVVGGAAKQTATLVAKPRIISIKTDPSGAAISIDGVVLAGKTPFDVELTKPQAAKKQLRIRVAKTGFKPVDKTVKADTFTEDDARMIVTIDEKLQAQAVIRPPVGGGSGSQAGSATPASGSGTPSGDGSAAPPPPPPPPPAGGGSDAPKSTGEPEPSVTNP